MNKLLRVLLVEDVEDDALLILRALRSGGFQPEHKRVETPEAMKSALADGSWDIIISDHSMPKFSGAAALALLRQTGLDVPFIVVSGTIGEETAVAMMKAGAHDYLMKGHLARLAPAVERELQEAEQHRQRRRAEESLRESEERFRQLAEHSSEGFWFATVKPEQIAYVSPAMERIWGQPAEKLCGQPRAWVAAIHQEDRPRIIKAFEAWIAGETDRFDQEYRVVRPDGSVRWVQDSGTAVRDGRGHIVRLGGIARDITERKQLEAQFFRAQRLESIGALAGGIAHDLNNALAPVLMGVELLKEGLGKEDRISMLDTMQASAQRGAEMVKQILTFARGVSGKPAVLEPKHLVTEIAKMCRDTFPPAIQVKNKVAQNVHRVEGNATQFHQVLLNLCVNARDAMPEGGTLGIEAANIVLDKAIAPGRSAAVSGPHLLLSVSDTGHGMSPEVLCRIFEPFYTTKGPDQGTGLGLSTVQGIVKAHNGFIEVSSEMGKGTTFKVYLPAILSAGDNEPSQTDMKFLTALAAGHGELILAVDDDLAILEMLRETLETYGYRVLTAGNGLEALPLYQKHAGEIAVVITDMMMPVMDGPATIRMLRQMNPQVKIIGVSGLGSESAVITAGKLTVQAFLKKPYPTELLLRKLREVVTEKP